MRGSLLLIGLASMVALSGCGGGGFPRIGLAGAPKVVNVSHYDPKECQRPGESYSAGDVGALCRNGALGLIARAGKGRELDTKFADFLGAAHRQQMLLGSYYFVLHGVDPAWQADRYVERVREVAASRAPGQPILLVGDFDKRSSAAEMVRFIDRVEARTGVLPVIYLENSAGLRRELAGASPANKARLRQCPYWLALYSPDIFPTPGALLRAHGVWDDYAMWQYAGVNWDARARRSVAKRFHAPAWPAPAYFGTLACPLEQNAFNGSTRDLQAFWARHSWKP